MRAVIIKLKLVPAGGNYHQVNERIAELKLNITHFTGQGWNVGWGFDPQPPRMPLEQILVKGRMHQGHSLKKRLVNAGLKERKCEICG